MESVFQRCCDQCWHQNDRRCPRFVECILQGPLCHEDEACRQKKKTVVHGAKRLGVHPPMIFVGAGTCGIGAGAQKTIEAITTYHRERKLEFQLVETGCIGLCTAEPIVDIALSQRPRISFCNVTHDKVEDLFGSFYAGRIPAEGVLGQFPSSAPRWEGVDDFWKHPFFAPQTRWVLANCGIIDPNSIEEYVAAGGYQALAKALRSQTPAECCELVEKSGLRGRGGAGFPTGKKWKLALQTPSDQKYFICNADEGDPGAFMDRAVIEGDPHRLLEGLAIAAYSIGATKAYVYIRAEYPLAIQRLTHAMAQAQENGFLGNNILDSGFNLTVVIKKGAGAFVCGEETALMHSIEGKRGMPRLRPPFPAESGLHGKPSVINNVETLANVPMIFDKGADAFAALGTATSKGTKVFALSGKVARTGLVEIAMGTRLRDIIFSVGGGIPNRKQYKAVQIGGPSGGCIPTSNLDIEIDYESLKSAGAMMGSGGLVVMDEETCMVDIAKFFMDFIQRESCGKCIPCREGTRRMLEILQRITRPARGTDRLESLERFKGVLLLEELAQVIRDTSLCGLGQSAPNPVLSTLRWFRGEYEAHIFDRTCPAKACVEMRVYTISEKACKGCALCAKKCPTQAIRGVVKTPHYIVTEKCIACGQCMDLCKFNAITFA